MANWYYYNKNGEKVGPISVAVLRELVAQGLITRETRVENQGGRTALAGKVNGLTFPETKTTPKPATPTPPLVNGDVYSLSSPQPAMAPPIQSAVPPFTMPTPPMANDPLAAFTSDSANAFSSPPSAPVVPLTSQLIPNINSQARSLEDLRQQFASAASASNPIVKESFTDEELATIQSFAEKSKKRNQFYGILCLVCFICFLSVGGAATAFSFLTGDLDPLHDFRPPGYSESVMAYRPVGIILLGIGFSFFFTVLFFEWKSRRCPFCVGPRKRIAHTLLSSHTGTYMSDEVVSETRNRRGEVIATTTAPVEKSYLMSFYRDDYRCKNCGCESSEVVSKRW